MSLFLMVVVGSLEITLYVFWLSNWLALLMKACLPSNQCTVPENTKLLQD